MNSGQHQSRSCSERACARAGHALCQIAFVVAVCVSGTGLAQAQSANGTVLRGTVDQQSTVVDPLLLLAPVDPALRDPQEPLPRRDRNNRHSGLQVVGVTAVGLEPTGLPTPNETRRLRAVQDDQGPVARPERVETNRRPPEDQTIRDTGRLDAVRSVGATGAIAPQARPATEADPYAPVGIRLGTFVLRPTLDVGVTSTRSRGTTTTGTPPVLSPGREAGTLSQVNAAVTAESDWVRHALSIAANGNFQQRLSGDIEGEPDYGIAVDGRIDVREGTAITFGGQYSQSVVAATSAGLALSSLSDEQVVGASSTEQHRLGATLGVTHRSGRVFGSATGRLNRTMNGSVFLDDGTLLDQTGRDTTEAGLTLRGGFEASPAFSPYAELDVARTIRDTAVDADGFSRDSNQFAVRLGTEVDLGDKLGGSMSLGLLRQTFDDDRLSAINALDVAANLDWSPRRGTDIALNASTTTEAAGLAFVSGNVVYSADATLTQQIRNNLSATFGVGITHSNPQGPDLSDTTLSANVGLTYWFNRNVGMLGRYTHETVVSGDPVKESNSDSLFIGLRFQR